MNPTSDPALDPARLDAIYGELAAMQVDLDADPLELGPKRLNEKIAHGRAMLSKCERIFLSISQDLHRYKRQHRAESADFKIRMRELLTNDPEVRMGRNVTDREAVASNRLRPQAEEIDRLAFCVEDLEAVLTVIRMKRADLKDIQGRLKDQLKVCQEEISLGGRWGRSPPTFRNGPREEDPVSSVRDILDSVLSRKIEETEATPEAVPETIPEELTGDPTLSVDDALGSIPDTTTLPGESPSIYSDSAIDDLLNSI